MTGALRRFGRRAGHLATTALLAAGWVLAVLPVWAVGRALRRDPLRSGWGSGSSMFVAPEAARNPDDRVRHPHRPARPGRPHPPRGGRARVVAAVILLTVAIIASVAVATRRQSPSLTEAPGAVDLTAGAVGGAGVRDLRTVPSVPDDQVRWAGLPVDRYAHEDEPFAKDLFRELTAAAPRPDPILGSRPVDARGEYVNIVDGRRVTWQPPRPAEVTVWFFGGSTMYGIGQRDDHTIPSVVARLAHEDGVEVAASNFDVSADVNWVETLRFHEALASDLPRPDLVVFYDGSNEQGVGFERVDSGRTDPRQSSRLAVSDEEREQLAVSAPGRSPDPAARAGLATELAATQYARGVRWARTIGSAAGIGVQHYWQPQPFAKQPSPADAELYRRLGFDPALLPAARASYDAIRERSGVAPIDLSTVLDDTDEPVFFDGSHTNELGARIVATAMYQQLRPALLEAARD